MQGPMYAASFGGVAVTAVQDLFQLLAANDVPFIVHGIRIGQFTDAGDAQAEMLHIQLTRTDFTINGSGGSTVTPRAITPDSSAADTIVEANNTTLSTVQTVLVEDSFNVQSGWLWMPTPEERILVPGGITNGFIVGLLETPDDSITMTGTIIFEEIK